MCKCVSLHIFYSHIYDFDKCVNMYPANTTQILIIETEIYFGYAWAHILMLSDSLSRVTSRESYKICKLIQSKHQKKKKCWNHYLCIEMSEIYKVPKNMQQLSSFSS